MARTPPRSLEELYARVRAWNEAADPTLPVLERMLGAEQRPDPLTVLPRRSLWARLRARLRAWHR